MLYRIPSLLQEMGQDMLHVADAGTSMAQDSGVAFPESVISDDR